MEQEIRFCKTSDGVRIAYAVAGSGPPLVRVLGWFTHLEYEWENARFRRTIEGAADRLTYIRYDGRGVGLSDRQVDDLSVDASVRDLEAVVDASAPGKVALMGVSQGGPTAITYVLRHPERVSHLILYGTGAWGGIQSEEEFKAMMSFIRQGWDSDVPAHRQFFTGLFVPDADIDAIQAFNEMQRLSVSAENVVALISARRGLDMRDRLPQVDVPTLVIHRRGDTMVPFEAGRELAAGIPGARFLPLDGRNHSPLAEADAPALEIMRNAIAEFLGVTGTADTATPPASPSLVTILFTDMEGSTPLTQRLGDAKAQEVLRAHNAIIRDALKGHGGSETKHTGDGIMASFGSAAKALECAVAIQRGFAEALTPGPSHSTGEGREGVRVRIGLNAGEPIAEDGPDGRRDLFGATVQLAARVCNRAEPGQVLVSNVVRELAMGKGFLFHDIGDVELKGFEDPVRLYEVRREENLA